MGRMVYLPLKVEFQVISDIGSLMTG